MKAHGKVADHFRTEKVTTLSIQSCEGSIQPGDIPESDTFKNEVLDAETRDRSCLTGVELRNGVQVVAALDCDFANFHTSNGQILRVADPDKERE